MNYHAEAFDLAVRRGLLERPEVTERVRHLPEWLRELQTPEGLMEMEQALDISIPASLAEFWQLPALVCLLDAWSSLAYVSHSLLTGAEFWRCAGKDYLEFAMHGHSGGSCVVEVAPDPDPLVWYSFLETAPTDSSGERLSAFIRTQVQEGIRRDTPIYKQHRCHLYHVSLRPQPGNAAEEIVAIEIYAGQSVRAQVEKQYPGREVSSIQNQGRSI